MNNPLYYDSKATGVKAAYEQAAFMDDTALDHVQFAPNQSKQMQIAQKVQTTKKETKVGLGVFGVLTICAMLPLVWIFNPILGVVATIGTATLFSKK